MAVEVPSPAALERLLRDVGRTAAGEPEPLAGGANNRVFRLDTDAGAVVVKAYFRDAADPRDRFAAERAFYELVWSAGVRRTPRPLAWDEKSRLGLFEHVAGEKPAAGEVAAAEVVQAAHFLAEINTPAVRRLGAGLAPASEACFSIAEHLAAIDRRVGRLEAMPAVDAVGRDAATFVRRELAPAWVRLRAAVLRGAEEAGLDADVPLAGEERCLSPSDFGFHNALAGLDGSLRFFDFEYAGWDDPAKTVADFFSQPRVPVPLEHWSRLMTTLRPAGWAGEVMEARARLLLPAYRLKWCCIQLNDFQRAGQRRRSFSLGGADAERKTGQLRKARSTLATALEDPSWPPAAADSYRS